MVDFDYVIVGSGTAGCALASRLSEDPGNRVLVLDEDFPGPTVSSPDDVVRYALDTGAGIYHAVGASAMGPDASDVVDPSCGSAASPGCASSTPPSCSSR